MADVENLEPEVLEALEQAEQGGLVGLSVQEYGRIADNGDLDILECGLDDRARHASHFDLKTPAGPVLDVTHSRDLRD